MPIGAISSVSTAFASQAFTAGGTNNIAQRVSDLKSTMFSNMVTGAEAVVQGIQAASIQGNSLASSFASDLISSRMTNTTSIQALVRQASYNPVAERFNNSNNGSQLFRMFLEDIRATVG